MKFGKNIRATYEGDWPSEDLGRIVNLVSEVPITIHGNRYEGQQESLTYVSITRVEPADSKNLGAKLVGRSDKGSINYKGIERLSDKKYEVTFLFTEGHRRLRVKEKKSGLFLILE